MSSDATPAASTAIAVYAEPGRAIRTVTEWDERQQAIRTSINTDTDDGKVAYISALAGKDYDLQDLPGKDEIIQDWLLHVREYVEPETGECCVALRLALLTVSGKVYSGGSKSLIDAWAAVVRMFKGTVPWPRLRLTITKVPRPGGKGSYLRLDRVQIVTETPPKRK